MAQRGGRVPPAVFLGGVCVALLRVDLVCLMGQLLQCHMHEHVAAVYAELCHVAQQARRGSPCSADELHDEPLANGQNMIHVAIAVLTPRFVLAEDAHLVAVQVPQIFAIPMRSPDIVNAKMSAKSKVHAFCQFQRASSSYEGSCELDPASAAARAVWQPSLQPSRGLGFC